jgi:hypothetical protein
MGGDFDGDVMPATILIRDIDGGDMTGLSDDFVHEWDGLLHRVLPVEAWYQVGTIEQDTDHHPAISQYVDVYVRPENAVEILRRSGAKRWDDDGVYIGEFETLEQVLEVYGFLQRVNNQVWIVFCCAIVGWNGRMALVVPNV